MKLCYVLLLLVISTACSAIDLNISHWFSGNAQPEKVVAPTWLTSQIATTTPIFLTSVDVNNSLVINGGSFSNTSTTEQHTALHSQSVFTAPGTYGFYTEFQFAIKTDLLLTGQWTRLHQAYNDGFDVNRALPPIEWSLTSDSRITTARAVGLNWAVFEGLQAYVKLQTVNGSAWVPQVNIPRFVTQDSESWTLAAVEVVYSF